MFRLVAYAHNGVQRFNLDRDRIVIGSDSDCDLHLPFSGVGHRHALVASDGQGVRIEDLGSRKGLLVNGERVKTAHLQVLDEIRLGSIALVLEDVQPEMVNRPSLPRVEEARVVSMVPECFLEHLARISQWVLSDSSSQSTLESLIIELLDDFGGGVLFLFQGEAETLGIKFVMATDAHWLGRGDEVLQQIFAVSGDAMPLPAPRCEELVGELAGEKAWIAYRSLPALDRRYLFVVAMPRFTPEAWSPLAGLRTLADQLILGLVHHVGQYEPLIFGRKPAPRDLTLAPGLIAGESKAMRRVLDELRAAVDFDLPVLLRGEPGISKELLARSLQLSSRRSAGPFITATCFGAAHQQIEIDIFGAEVAGKRGPVEREGKLLLADGGALLLEEVDQLPLRLQDRLMRFLRSAEVEPVESLSSRRVNVRLIATSRLPLEQAVARDLFRPDLAYRLSQFVVEVPALRERREDLPLLIQAEINRACHSTGKRIQGITVKAMELLARHDYPGNLDELESVVRRLVYLCPSGRPIDDSLLPEDIRLAQVRVARPDAASELNLERLIEACERGAIVEALRRADGNKSEAARLLGLSRNGLAQKSLRLGLDRT